MNIGDVVMFRDIETPTQLVVSNVISIQFVEILYFDKDDIIRKETILKSLLK
jgi:hypothetical protein